MTAICCLRILFTDGESQPGEVPKHKAQGVADAFLKARWRAPRKCGAVAPMAFVLADNRVENLDPSAMQALAAELEIAIREDQGRDTIEVLIARVDEAQSAVVTAILALPGADEKTAEGPAPTAPGTAVANEALAKLDALLAEDNVAATRFVREQGDVVKVALGADWPRFERELSAYDFPAALGTLRARKS